MTGTVEIMWVDDNVCEGRPAGGLSGAEEAAYSRLEQAGAPFVCVRHDEAATIGDCREVEDALDVKICKNLLLNTANRSEYFLLVMPGEKRFSTKGLSGQIGCSRLSFSNAEDMEALLGVAPGAVSVLALENDTQKKVKLIFDRDILKEDFFGCHPCKNTASLRITTRDLVEKVLPLLGREAAVVSL
jgi:Ala-tRNA(Pro) deacylase